MNKLLSNKWFFFKNKLNVFTNTVTPANHLYISSSNSLLYFKIIKKISPIDITGVDNNSSTNIDLISFDLNMSTISHTLWQDSNSRNYSLNTPGLEWSARELSEFFGVNSLLLQDTRNMLLDYSFHLHPLKKHFPTQGFEEVYFNFYTQQVELSSVNFIEL